MKLFVKGKVYEIGKNGTDTLQVDTHRDIAEYQCLGEISGSGGATVHTAVVGKRYAMSMSLKKTCCTKKLHKVLAKKFFKNAPLKLVIQLDNKQEISGTVFISKMEEEYKISDNLPTINYETDFTEEPKITTPIDWNIVENEGEE